MKYTHVSNVSVGYVPTEYTLWWTWRESNPRPECLHFEGITTILFVPTYAGTMLAACLPF